LGVGLKGKWCCGGVCVLVCVCGGGGVYVAPTFHRQFVVDTYFEG